MSLVSDHAAPIAQKGYVKAPDSGAVYVYVHNGASDWTFQAYLKSSNPGTNDGFGKAVAIFGDTIGVGAPTENGSGTGVNPKPDELGTFSGAAYVFSGIDTPEIAVSQNSTDIPNAGSRSFGNVLQDNTADLTFTISNSGAADLTLIGSPLGRRERPGRLRIHHHQPAHLARRRIGQNNLHRSLHRHHGRHPQRHAHDFE